MERIKAKVIGRNIITPEIFELKVEKVIDFISGQNCAIGLANGETRDYSIYSAKYENYLSFLIKLIPNGVVSNQLFNLSIGDWIDLVGPHGYFYPKSYISNPIDSNLDVSSQLIFIATGVGIAPIHSFIKSTIYELSQFNHYLPHIVLHGVKMFEESLYFQREIYSGLSIYNSNFYIPCIKGHTYNRVTKYLTSNETPVNEILKPANKFYLCGNNNMINDVHEILVKSCVHPSNIFTEVFF